MRINTKSINYYREQSTLDFAEFLYLLLLNDILNVRSWKTAINSERLK